MLVIAGILLLILLSNKDFKATHKEITRALRANMFSFKDVPKIAKRYNATEGVAATGPNAG